MDKAQAIEYFWSQFGIPCYDEGCVPKNAKMPYITYDVVEDEMGNVVNLVGNIWYYSTSWKEATLKMKEVTEAIGNGLVIKLDKGYLYIYKGHPFSQRVVVENDMVRRLYINIQAEYLTAI